MPKSKPYDPNSSDLFKISRTGVELFLNCKKCFYLRYRLQVTRVSGPPFNINNAVDSLLKNEFDGYRQKKEPHPLMIGAGIDAIPFEHENLNQWRHNFTGVQFHDHERGFLWFGAIDDVWIHNQTGELIIADYKATSKKDEVNLDADWQISYKNQMEFYQWLMRKNDFKVSNEGWFVYCNGISDKDSFNHNMEFKISMLPYIGDDSWIENVLDEIKITLDDTNIPEAHPDCGFCKYVEKYKLADQ